MAIATKLVRTVIYLRRLLTVKSYKGLIRLEVMQGHVTNKNLYIFTARVLLQPKFDRMMTSLDGLFYKVA